MRKGATFAFLLSEALLLVAAAVFAHLFAQGVLLVLLGRLRRQCLQPRRLQAPRLLVDPRHEKTIQIMHMRINADTILHAWMK